MRDRYTSPVPIQRYPPLATPASHLHTRHRLHQDVSRSPPTAAGYGHCTIPTVAGCHTLTVHTWRPYGTLREQISSAPPRPHARSRTFTELRSVASVGERLREEWLRSLAEEGWPPRRVAMRPRSRSPADADAPPPTHRAAAFFLGGTPRLKHTEIVSSPADRFRLHTQPSGEVQLQLNVLTKDFSRYGVHC